MIPKPKIVIIGLDAAVMTLVRPWVQQGHLPNLAALMAEGISGEIESVIPPLTPAAWTSLMTGKDPGKHGIYKFVENVPHSYSFQFTNGSNRRAETLWKMANRAGYTVGVMNTPFTYPPEKLDGFQISGLDTPSSESAFVHPPELKKELEEKFGPILVDSRFLGEMTSLEKRARMLDEFKKSDEQWSQMALYLMENHPQDITMFTFMSIDTVEHHFWHYMDPEHFSHDPEGAKLFRHAIREVYQRLDATIGEIVRRLDSSAHVLVVSDHGQEAVSDRTLYINRILHQAGLLAYKPVNPLDALLRAVMRPVHDLLRRHLTHHQKMLLSTLFPKLREGADAILTSYSEIDWSRTEAFCYENWTCGSISVNLKGVKPQGIVEPADYDKVIEKVRAALYAVKDPRTGEQIIAHAYRWDEIYHGPYANCAADLTLNWWGPSRFNVKPSLRHQSHLPPLRLEKHEPLRTPEWSGHHSFHGMLVASGPGFKSGETIHGARLIDIAPTLLHLLGLPVPEDMDGRVLEEAIDSRHLPRPARAVPAPAGIPEPAASGREYDYSREEAAQVETRLKNLGYLE